jgi:hypothetical protein
LDDGLRKTVYDLVIDAPLVAEVSFYLADAVEAVTRDPARYSFHLPPGKELSEHRGANCIVPGQVNFVPRC